MPIFDEKHGLREEDIVGWKIWYEDETSESSRTQANTNRLLTEGVQGVRIWHRRAERPAKLYGLVYTGLDDYKMPETNKVFVGTLLDEAAYLKIYNSIWADETFSKADL